MFTPKNFFGEEAVWMSEPTRITPPSLAGHSTVHHHTYDEGVTRYTVARPVSYIIFVGESTAVLTADRWYSLIQYIRLANTRFLRYSLIQYQVSKYSMFVTIFFTFVRYCTVVTNTFRLGKSQHFHGFSKMLSPPFSILGPASLFMWSCLRSNDLGHCNSQVFLSHRGMRLKLMATA